MLKQRDYKKLCGHCGIRARVNGIGSLCEWCWQNVANRHNSQPHKSGAGQCPLTCWETH